MKTKFVIISAITLVALIDHSFCQTYNVIVNVEQFIEPNFDILTFRCSGAIISPQHVITTADCANVEMPFDLAVRIFVTPTSYTAASVSKVSIHPDYAQRQAIESNIAVLQTPIIFDKVLRPARTLGSLQPGTNCSLFGWGSVDSNPRRDVVTISQSCDPNFPDLFCSHFSTSEHESCSANLGAPVVCSPSGNTIDGILITGSPISSACQSYGAESIMNFISIDYFADWINCEVSSNVPCTESENLSDMSTQSGKMTKASIRTFIIATVAAVFLIH